MKNFRLIENEILKEILLYFESHRELLSDPNYKCAYSMTKNKYVSNLYGNISIYDAFHFYKSDIQNSLSKLNNEEIESYQACADHLVSIVKRLDLANNYVDIFEEYNK